MSAHLKPEALADRLARYRAGATDPELARADGVSPTAIVHWRKAHGLPSHRPRGLSPAENARRLALYRAGLNDREIARILGINHVPVRMWRHARGLPANDSASANLSPEKHAARVRRYERGWSDRKIGQIEGVSQKAILKWRKCHGLTCLHGQDARRLQRDTVAGRVRRAVGWGISPDIADDAMAEMMLALVEGRLSHDRIEAEARGYVNRAIGEYASRYGPRSIDEEIGGDGFRMVDLIADTSASSWLEEMGATVW